MEWTVVVYDTDSLRSSVMCNALEQCKTPYSIQIHAVGDSSKLKTVVSREKVDVVFCDVRAKDAGVPCKDVVRDVVAAGLDVQVVFTGVCEKDLVDVEMQPHSFLLPTSSSEEDVAYALNRSIALRAKEMERPIIIKTRKCSRTIKPSHVSFIESDLRKVRIHLGNDTIEAYERLSVLLDKLPRRFVQCHKSFVVNLGFVSEFGREHLVLTTGECVPVSQKRRKQTREAFDLYAGRTL